ncbi:MAG: type II secretion system protein [Luteolibacter sp.]
MKNQVFRRSAGFTLVELLVVIVIIATLAGLAFLGYGRMRAIGDRAAAISVMRQLVVANISYSSDHGGQFVPIARMDENNALQEWFYDPEVLSYLTGDPESLTKTKAQREIAPVGLLDPVVNRARKKDYQKLSASYGMNSTGLGQFWPKKNTDPPMSYKYSQVANPSRTAFMISATDYQVSFASRYLWKTSPVEGKSPNQKMAYRHDNKAIVIYYDGSTGFVSMADMAKFDANGGDANPFWKALP